jgi:uncharacterized membrane protein
MRLRWVLVGLVGVLAVLVFLVMLIGPPVRADFVPEPCMVREVCGSPE